MKRVIENIIPHGWCIGCGACAGVCPTGKLSMAFNRYGEYEPMKSPASEYACPPGCNLCFTVCPAHGTLGNEDSIAQSLFADKPELNHCADTGFYGTSYVGYAASYRRRAASGGYLTYCLTSLLQEDFVDAVACVHGTSNPEALFEYTLCNKPEELASCMGSAYFPVEISAILEHIRNHDGRYAIVGLPCVCKAVRLAQARVPALQRRIRLVLGLVCGRQASRFFIEYIAAKEGVSAKDLRGFRFRVKNEAQPARDTFGSCTFVRRLSRQDAWESASFSSEWSGAYFKPEGCFYCDDIFAECADAVFMDAWLEPYSQNPYGHSIVLPRNATIESLFAAPRSDDVHAMPIDIEDVRRSQERVIHLKRRRAAAHIRRASRSGFPPARRTALMTPLVNPIERRIETLLHRTALRSREAWVATEGNIQAFRQELAPLTRDLTRLRRLLTLLSPSFWHRKIVDFAIRARLTEREKATGK